MIVNPASTRMFHWCNTQYKNVCAPFDKGRYRATQILERILRVLIASFGYLGGGICWIGEKAKSCFTKRESKIDENDKTKDKISSETKKLTKPETPPADKSPLRQSPDDIIRHISSFLTSTETVVFSSTSHEMQQRIRKQDNKIYNAFFKDLFCNNHFLRLPLCTVEDFEDKYILNFDGKRIEKTYHKKLVYCDIPIPGEPPPIPRVISKAQRCLNFQFFGNSDKLIDELAGPNKNFIARVIFGTHPDSLIHGFIARYVKEDQKHSMKVFFTDATDMIPNKFFMIDENEKDMKMKSEVIAFIKENAIFKPPFGKPECPLCTCV